MLLFVWQPAAVLGLRLGLELPFQAKDSHIICTYIIYTHIYIFCVLSVGEREREGDREREGSVATFYLSQWP